uniref:Hydroxysteroid (17-beta) dehydrogenase 3 n=1 Tax=Gasterosteus aculeatus aculeatus TaxID=481459 RepID=G3NV81_GASAC
MDLMELFFITLGFAVIVCYGVRLLLFSKMLFPKIWFPLPKYFFTSMGAWAVVTGASEGIGRAYALALAEQGMNVVIMSRTKAALEDVAKEIVATTGQRVKVIVTDLMEDVFSEIEDQLCGLNIGILVNNVGMLPSVIPSKFLECAELDQTITKVINCNVKSMAKMCKIILPGMENRGKGVIVNISSGIASIPFPLYTLYAASKTVAPFGVSTRMADYQKTNTVTLSPEDFVKSSLQYLRAGDKTHGSVCHIFLGWLLQSIPAKILYAECVLHGLQDYVKKRAQKTSVSVSSASSEQGRNG